MNMVPWSAFMIGVALVVQFAVQVGAVVVGVVIWDRFLRRAA